MSMPKHYLHCSDPKYDLRTVSRENVTFWRFRVGSDGRPLNTDTQYNTYKKTPQGTLKTFYGKDCDECGQEGTEDTRGVYVTNLSGWKIRNVLFSRSSKSVIFICKECIDILYPDFDWQHTSRNWYG